MPVPEVRDPIFHFFFIYTFDRWSIDIHLFPQMSTPVHEIPEPSFPHHGPPGSYQRRPSIPAHMVEGSSGGHTYTDELPRHQLHDQLGPPTGTTTSDDGQPHYISNSRIREENHRLEDDLELLRAERIVTNASGNGGPERSKSRRDRSRSRVTEIEPVDDFDISTNPVHDNGKGVWRPPEKPANKLAKLLRAVSINI